MRAEYVEQHARFIAFVQKEEFFYKIWVIYTDLS